LVALVGRLLLAVGRHERLSILPMAAGSCPSPVCGGVIVPRDRALADGAPAR
jgi:hypothetical protein